MPVTVPLLLVSLILALVAIAQSRRPHRTASLRVVPQVKPVSKRVSSLLRTGHIGDGVLGDPVRTTVRIAPVDAPHIALEISDLTGQVLAQLTVAETVMARGWSSGHVVLGFGETRREYGPSWALGPNLAGWELHLVSASGEMLRCYGVPASAAADDLDRLRTRIHHVVLEQAS